MYKLQALCVCVGGGWYVYHSALQNFTNETTSTELFFHFNFTFFKQCHLLIQSRSPNSVVYRSQRLQLDIIWFSRISWKGEDVWVGVQLCMCDSRMMFICLHQTLR